MFWRFGGYANISTLNNILEKPDVTLDEVLEEADLIQELKQSNSKLIEFLRDENVLRRLLEYVVAPAAPKPADNGDDSGDESADEDEEVQLAQQRQQQQKSLSPFRRKTTEQQGKKKDDRSRQREAMEEWEKADKQRTKNAYTACEVLSSETWSILESLMDNQELLSTFWASMSRKPPMDATEAGYFTKINETLLDKKTEEMIRFLHSLDGIIPAMLNHIDCAAVMDLLLKIISMEKSEGGFGVVDWLQSQDLIPRLLAFLTSDNAPGTQTSAGDFMKAIVTISANASQNEQSCIGPNNLTRQLVSEACMENLLSNMLRGGNPLTVGVGLIIEIIRKNNSDYDPDVGSAPDHPPSSNDPIYLGTMLRCFARRVPDFMNLLLSPTHAVSEGDREVTIKRKELGMAFGNKIEPLGFDRFKTCELMAELLHCSNMGLLNERGSEAFIRQRDEERERLKAQGQLTSNRVPDSAVTEFSEDSGAFTNGVSPLGLSTSSDETRKLGIANNSVDDDGFEDVGHPLDLADDIKDDFDDKTSYDIAGEDDTETSSPLSAKAFRPRLDLDEDFVDEPLTSPKLEAVDEKDAEYASAQDISIPAPLHPHSAESHDPVSSNLASHIDHLKVNEEASTSDFETSPPGETRSPEPIALSNSPQNASHGTPPPLPQRGASSNSNLASPNFDIDPIQDAIDQPAPLFAGGHAHDSSRESPEKVVPNINDDSHVGEEESNMSTPYAGGADQSFNSQFEYDIDGEPMVGDFLKIMFVEHRVVPTILDFFFRFPWNNFLHNVVYDVVQQVFNGPVDRGFNRFLAVDLFQAGRITERIIEGQTESDEAQAKNNMRLGYMGHLTLVAEEVVKFSDRQPPEMLSPVVLERVTSQAWNMYVETTLTETRERDNAILGGVRPDMSLGPRQAVLNAVNAAGGNFGGGVSSALTNAGLNGNAGLDTMDLGSNGSGTSNSAFGISSGSLLSGFGSSSDEEDEEIEDMDEGDSGGLDIVHESPSTSSLPESTPNATNDNSSIPPNDPPPAPPPLKVPPSRARRQLAARLALHQQQKADEADSSGTSSSPNKEHPASPTLDDGAADDADDDRDNVHANQQDKYTLATAPTNLITSSTPSPLLPPTSTQPLQSPTSSPSSKSSPPTISSPSKDPVVAGTKNNKADPFVSSTGGATTARHLDLDDFANSPAADAEDAVPLNDEG